MGPSATVARGVAAGAVAWSATEYAVHRWLMHGSRTGNPVTAEHLDHHRHLERTDPLRFDRFLLWPAAAGVATGLPVALAGSRRAGVATGASFAACYCAYRQLHWSIHHRPPRTRWGRSLRRHHLRHHVGAPRTNHGVTTPLWDLLLGTYRNPPGPVALPTAMAPPWLHGADGTPRPDLAGDYALR